MKKNLKLMGIIALVAAIVFSMAACVAADEGDPLLSGDITISPNSGVKTGTELTATYSGSETVTYQWQKDETNVGTDSDKYTPTEAGSYTVTVSASGYRSITSDPVTVTVPTGPTWTTVEDSTFGTSFITEIIRSNNKLVAVGYDGKMAYSSDNGVTWTAVEDSTFGTSFIQTVVYLFAAYVNNPSDPENPIKHGGKYIAAGSNGKMATSTDGTTWTAVTDSTFGTSNIYAIGYGMKAGGGYTLVAAGSNGKMATSTDDGVTWTAVTTTTFGTDPIYGIAYGGNGKFVAVGSMTNGKMAYSSDDGTTWTAVTDSTFGTSGINKIVNFNNKFIAASFAGKMAYSSDGVTWTPVANTILSSFIGITYDNNKLVTMTVVVEGETILVKVATSSDGVTWTAVPGGSPFNGTPLGIAYSFINNGKFLVFGGNGQIVCTTEL
jgi:photosystem II stability/assembly factor-like uncharacterized protein